MKPMHLALICEAWPSTMHGDVGPFALAKQLVLRGHRVSVLCNGIAPIESEDALDVYTHLPTSHVKSRRLRGFLRWQEKARRSVNADKVISTTSTVPCDLLVCLLGTYRQVDHYSADNISTRVSANLQVLKAIMQFGKNHVHTERGLFKRGDIGLAIAVSTLIEASLKELMRDPEKVSCIDLPLPRLDFDVEATNLQREQLCRAWGIETDLPWFVYTSNVNGDRRGFEWLLCGFRAFIDRGGKAVLLLTGSLSFARLKWIAQLGLRDHVVCVGEVVDPPAFYALADLFVSTADVDPGGWGVRQALASGRHVIATDGCGQADAIRKQGGVVLDQPVDINALATAMLDAIKRPMAQSPSMQKDGTLAADPRQVLADRIENLLRTL